MVILKEIRNFLIKGLLGLIFLLALIGTEKGFAQGFIGDVFDCFLEPDFAQPNNFGIRLAGNSLTQLGDAGAVVSFASPLVADLNGDGRAEIIILGYDETEGPVWTTRKPRYTNKIKIFKFDGTAFTPVLTIAPPGLRIPYDAMTPMALVNIAPEGQPNKMVIIVATSHTAPTNPSKLIAYNANTGVEEWVSDSPYGVNVPLAVDVGTSDVQMSSGAAVGVADFNRDGIPEVYIYNEIFNARTGAKLADGGANGQGINSIYQDGGAYGLSVAADITNHPGLELAAGNTVYNVNITNTNGMAGNSMEHKNPGFLLFGSAPHDGFTSIADINGDGRLDLVVTTAYRNGQRYMYVWNPNHGGLIGFSVLKETPAAQLNQEIRTGAAFIGDIKGTGEKPYIGIVSPYWLEMFSYELGNSFAGQRLNIKPEWEKVTNDRSGFTTITMFDFNQNGQQELVYRDERKLRILDSNGVDLPGISGNDVFSMTGGEGPVVADVTGDGEADILITNVGEFLGQPTTQRAGLEVWKSALGQRWAPARNIWNQYAYFAFNINDDLRVPLPQLNHARDAFQTFPQFDPSSGCVAAELRVFNSFLVQTTFFDGRGCRTTGIPIMNAQIEIEMARFICYDPDPQIEVRVRVHNAGDLAGTDNFIPADTKISFFIGNVFIDGRTVGSNVPAGQSLTLSFIINSSVPDNNNSSSLALTAIINADQNKNFEYIECTYLDNDFSLPIISRPQFSVAAPPPVCFQDASGTVNSFLLTPVNSLLGSSVDSQQLQWFRDNTSGSPIANGDFINGVQYTIGPDFSLEITGLQASATPYVFILRDGCTGLIHSRNLTVDFMPTPSFSTERVICHGESNGRIRVLNELPAYRYTINGTNYNNKTELEAAGFSFGDYSIEVRNSVTGCVAFFPVTITQPDPLEIFNAQKIDPVCLPNTGEISWEIRGGNTLLNPGNPYMYSLTRDGNPVNGFAVVVENGRNRIKELIGGNYVLTATDEKGCTTPQNFALVVQVDPEFNVSNATVCFEEDALVEVTMDNSGVPAAAPSYAWGKVIAGNFEAFIQGQPIDGGTVNLENGGRTARFVGLPASADEYVYHIQVTGPNTCGQDLREARVRVNLKPDVLVAKVDPVECFGESNGKIHIQRGPSAGSDSYNYQLEGMTNAPNNGVFENLPAGTYTVIAINSVTGCRAILPGIIVQQPDPLEIFNPQKIDPVCLPNTGELSWQIRGGNTGQPYTYTLSREGNPVSDFTVVTDVGNNSIKDLPGGNYLLTARDEKNCSTTQVFALVVQVDPEFSVSNATVCFEEDAMVEVTMDNPGVPAAAPSYAWGKLIAGTFVAFTEGQAIDGGNVYLENGGRTARFVNLPPSVDEYLYQLQVTGTNTCDQELLVGRVKINPKPDVLVVKVDDVLCFGESNGKINLERGPSAGSDSYGYELVGLNNPFTNGGFENLPEGTYTVIAINATTGCRTVLPGIQVTQPTELLLSNDVEAVPTCSEANGIFSINFQGGTLNYTLRLTRNGTTMEEVNDFTGGSYGRSDLLPGSYVFRVTDAQNCFKEYGFTLTNDPKAPIDYSLTDIETCEGQVVEINPNVDTQGISRTVSWYLDAAGTRQIATGQDPNVGHVSYAFDGDKLIVSGLLQNEVREYYLSVAGPDFCPIPLGVVKVSASSALNISHDFPEEICFGEGMTLTVSASGGNNQFEYALDGGPFQASPIFDNVPVGPHTLDVRTSQGCWDSRDFEVLGPSAPIAANDDPVIIRASCNEANGSIANIQISGGWGSFKTEWRKDNAQTGALIASDTLKIRDLLPGTYYLIVTDEKGCQEIFPYTLEQQPLPDVVIQAQMVCEGTDIVLTPVQTVSGATSSDLIWYFDAAGTLPITNGPDANNPEIIYSIDSDLILTVTGLRGGEYSYYLNVVCTKTAVEGKATINVLPSPEFGVKDILCFGEKTGKINALSGSDPNFRYIVNTDPPMSQAQLEAAVFDAGTYTIKIENIVTGCSSTEILEIEQPLELVYSEISFQNATCGDANGEFTFSVEGGVENYIVLINGSDIGNFTVSEANGTYTVLNLLPGVFDIAIQDENGCALNRPAAFTLINNAGIPIQADDMEDLVCEGAPLVFTPLFTAGGSIEPTKRWYRDAALTQVITPNYNPAGTGIMYQVDPATGRLTVYNLPPGTYNYYLQLSHPEICTLVRVAKGEITTGITAAAATTDEICFGDQNGSITISGITGGSRQYQLSIDNTDWQNATLFDDLAPGTYTVFIRDLQGTGTCTFSIPNLVIGSAAGPIVSDNETIQRSSCGEANGSIALEITGGWGGYTVQWNKDAETGPAVPGNASGASGLSPGTYFLTVVDAQGCREVFDFVITEQNQPNFVPVDPMDICASESIRLSAINNVSDASPTGFVWSKGPNKTNPIAQGADPALTGVQYILTEDLNNLHLDISGLAQGTYTYYLFIECTGQELPYTFEVFDSPDVVFGKTDISCFNANDGKIFVTSGGSNHYTYSINGVGSLTQTELELLEFEEGQYVILAKNLIDCSGVPQTIIIDNPALVVVTVVDFKNSACGTNDGFIEVAVTGGIPGYSLSLIKDGQQIQNLSSANGQYTFTNLGGGDYQVRVSDTNSCSAELPNLFELIEGPTEILVNDLVICEGETATFVPSINPTVPNPQYTWYWNALVAGNEISNNQNIGGVVFNLATNGTLTINGLQINEDYTLWVTVSGPGVCLGDEKKVTVRVDPQPFITAVGTDELCLGDGGRIVVSSSNGQSNLLFSLNGDPFQAYPNNTIVGLSQGNYIITARNEGGCDFTLADPVVISGPAAALAISGLQINPSTCQAADGRIRAQVNGGSPGYTIVLLNAAGVVTQGPIQQTASAFEFTGLAEGAYAIRITDSNGCETTQTGIAIADVPSEISVEDVTICEGEVANLEASFNQVSGSPEWLWYYDPNKANPVLLGSGPDQYGAIYESPVFGQLSMTGLPGRQASYVFYLDVVGNGVCPPELEEVMVTVHPLPNLRVSNPSIVCDPTETVDLTRFIEGYNPNVFDYIVEHPDGTVMRLENISNVSESGSYTVEASLKGLNCWSASERIAVIIADRELIANYQYEIMLNGTAYVNSEVQIEDVIDFRDLSQGDAIIWKWDFGDGNSSTLQNPSHTYFTAGSYLVRLSTINTFGCTSVYEKLLQVFDDYLIIIPNAFTPDGSINKHFMPKFRGIAAMKLYVFTTWGDLIFETESMEGPGWDGTLNGQNTPNGNYVYRAIFTARNGEKVDRAGVFTLVR